MSACWSLLVGLVGSTVRSLGQEKCEGWLWSPLTQARGPALFYESGGGWQAAAQGQGTVSCLHVRHK